MKKYSFFAVGIALLLAGTLIVLAACFSPYQGDKGTFSVNIGGSPGGRAQLWWNSLVNSENLTHIITLSGGPGPDQTLSIDGHKTVGFSVQPGVWEIDIEGFSDISAGFLESEGYAKVNIKPGPNGAISLKMYPILDYGDPGEGGGRVFYDSKKEGFKEGFIDTYTGKLCRYLEVSTTDQGSFLWVPNGDVPGTKEGIGTGRKNTRLILADDHDNPTPFILACINYSESGHDDLNDWYLPSKGELEQLIQNATSGLLSGTYWSSTQGDAANHAWANTAPSGVESHDAKDIPGGHKVRPIRAF